MALEVHVWGTAFGLPSIDPECIATVCLFNHFLAPGVQWTLVPNFDLAFSPNQTFPVLVDGEQKIAGFKRICNHLRKRELLSAAQLETGLEHDASAVSSFVRSQGRQLLDLSLYVSSENYYETTRSAYTQLLPLHINYFLPLHIRGDAKTRTQHLGLSALDLDAEEESNPRQTSSATKLPTPAETAAQAGRVQKGITSFLRRSRHVDHIRLDSLSGAFLDTIEEFLEKHEFLTATDEPALVDCVAFGYLALMLYPNVPHNWLADAIRRRPKTRAYIGKLRTLFLDDAGALPWSPAPRRGLAAPLGDLGRLIRTSALTAKPSSQVWMGMVLLVGCIAFRSGTAKSPAVNYVFPAR